MRKVLLTILATLVILVILFLAYIYSGTYNIAASEPDTALEQWALNTAMVRSVESHAKNIEVPSLTDSSMIAAGFHAFDEMCVTCHGAPGVEASFIGKGLRPEPPELSEVVPHWRTAELYWIVEHGIKMTGMPAFGGTHKDQELWEIVAFLEELPDITPEQYQTLKAQAADETGHGHDHQHRTGESPEDDDPTHTDGHSHEH